MTEVTQEELRDFLSTVFDVDEKYIVPKQWNWYNPQMLADKPLTWMSFRIKTNRPISTNFKIIDSSVVDEVTTYTQYLSSYNIAEIELQFIGKRAEEYAGSIQFFPQRSDIRSELEDCGGVIMLNDFRAYPSDYILDGLNTVISWNVNFKIEWTKKQLVDQDIAQGIDSIGGTLNE